MAYPAEEIIDIAESKANRLSLMQNPITGERTLTRGWKAPADIRKASVVKYLNSVTAVTNPLCDNGQAQGNVTDSWDVLSSGWDDNYKGYVQVLRLASPWNDGVAGNGTKVAEDLYEKTEQKDYFDQASVPTVTPYAVGILKTLSVAIDKFKRWRVSLSTRTSKEVSLTFTITKFGATEVHTVMRNQTPVDAKPTLPSPSAGRMIDYASSPSCNPDGTWNWHAVDRPTDAILDPGATITKRQWGYKYMNAVWGATAVGDIPGGGDDQFYKWRMTVYVDTVYTVHSTATAAWAAGQGVPDYMGHGRWLSVNRGTEHIFTVDRVGRLP